MDDKDRLLLMLLRRDARRPVVALARDVGLSRTATQDRLARLETSGAIASYTIVEGKGTDRERAYLIVKLEPGCRCAQIVPGIRALPAVEAIDSITGSVDMVVRVSAEHIEGIEAVRSALVGLPGVAEVTTHIVLERWVG